MGLKTVNKNKMASNVDCKQYEATCSEKKHNPNYKHSYTKH